MPLMHEALTAAVVRGGGRVTEPAEAEALILADPRAAGDFPSLIGSAPNVRWVQLPYAGVETFTQHLDTSHVWTCGKGVYARPVAEHVVACALAGFRNLHAYARATSWTAQKGRNLLGASVTILGAGGITDELVALLEPFGCNITVVRRKPEPHPGAHRTVATADLDEILPDTDLLVVAWALTDRTSGRINRSTFEALPEHAWIVNVGRGAHIVTDDLVDALERGNIAGAAIDVTDPEPLPDGHPLWHLDNCLITPHVGNTLDMGRPLLAARVEQNVRLFCEPHAPDDLSHLIGLVDVAAGY
ncbi:MAG: hydroxyacid dehydrogenase [Actinomycetia bacterium]|nr:hydroxyacid dehydrogenase [Actinomycetes bacterium]